jgi:hypothetical protein
MVVGEEATHPEEATDLLRVEAMALEERCEGRHQDGVETGGACDRFQDPAP